MKKKTACFTGHRVIPKYIISKLTAQLREIISASISNGIRFYGCGGAVGFDMLAGFTVLEMKKQYPHIKLIMVLPCENQDIKWNRDEKERHKILLSQADKVVYVQKKYDSQCMFRRNRHLVNNSSLCIAYMTKCTGGTFYTVNYASSLDCKIINIAEFLQS